MQGKFFVTLDNKLPSLQSTYAYQGFPVRNIRRSNTDDGGAWLVELKTEKRKQLKALRKPLPPKPVQQKPLREFTGYFIIKHCHVEDPKDICILNVSGKDLGQVENEDFSLFENVIRIDASDNQLNLETFCTFPQLENLELQVNNISCVHIHHKDFISLQKLDLSYNNLTHTALLNLGKLRNILELCLRGCGLKSLPPQLARKYQVSDRDTDEHKIKAETKARFPSLVTLDLSENELTDISTFASLAGLRKLKCLSLSCNKISGVPHLRLMAAHRHFSMSTCTVASAAHIQQHQQQGADSDNDVRHVVSEILAENTALNIPTSSITTAAEAVVEIPETTTENEVVVSAATTECGDIHATTGEINVAEKTENPVRDAEEKGDERDDTAQQHETENSASAVGKDGDMQNENDVKSDEIEATSDVHEVEMDETDAALNDENEIFLDDIEKALSQINSEKDMDEASDLMNINFAKELNFSLYNNRAGGGDNIVTVVTPEPTENDLIGDLDTLDIAESPVIGGDDLFDDELRLPFPCLATLDLSYNDIEDEESLLALTGWQMLQDLKLWGNPLMRTFKGTPPVLLHHLTVMCGINIHRKEPRSDRKHQTVQPPSLVASKKIRRVKTDLPPIKRNSMLAIENMILQAIESKSTICEDDVSFKRETKSEGDLKTMKDEESSPIETGQEDAETFFLTQVDEGGIEMGDDEEDEFIGNMQNENGMDEVDRVQNEQELQLQLTDYNSLLHVEEEDDLDTTFMLPKSIQGSVAALKHMLGNELVFNTGHYNKFKAPTKQKKVKKFQQKQPVDETLDNIRLDETSYEENLENVLDDFQTNSELREKFPHAKKMMNKVQKKYDQVRLKSLRPMSDAQRELEKVSTRVDERSQGLLLSRMKRGKIGEFYSTSRNNTPRIKIRGARYEKTS